MVWNIISDSSCDLRMSSFHSGSVRFETVPLRLLVGEREFADDDTLSVPELLAASDVFVFPSLQEGLPVAQMEAMAAGLPCVVSDVRGNRDLIARGEGGFLRAPRDARGFSEDIARLLEDPALRTRMGERNRREMEKYGLEAVRSQMAALYLGQLEARGR